MGLNRKLTPIVKGRSIGSVEQDGALLNLTFTDGSTMRVKTGAPAPEGKWQGQPVARVRQAGDVLDIDFATGATLEIKLGEATSSVMLRDASGNLEYAD